jgi:hypothetical protein
MYFHVVIRVRAQELVDEHGLRLPELEVMLELDEPQVWFPVPGMYGGFYFWLQPDGADTLLVSDSWCRIVASSEERRNVTASGVGQVSHSAHDSGPVIILRKPPSTCDGAAADLSRSPR